MKTLAEVQQAAGIQRELLEKDVQKQCVDWARKRGYWARKFSSMSQRSVPDYIFGKFLVLADPPVGGYTQTRDVRLKFFTEFKRPGQTSTAAQKDEQQAMIDAGWLGFECDSFDKFKYEVERLEGRCCSGEI